MGAHQVMVQVIRNHPGKGHFQQHHKHQQSHIQHLVGPQQAKKQHYHADQCSQHQGRVFPPGQPRQGRHGQQQAQVDVVAGIQGQRRCHQHGKGRSPARRHFYAARAHALPFPSWVSAGAGPSALALRLLSSIFGNASTKASTSSGSNWVAAQRLISASPSSKEAAFL
jgi:hypothetical protein